MGIQALEQGAKLVGKSAREDTEKSNSMTSDN
jgi:hypothetical protein